MGRGASSSLVLFLALAFALPLNADVRQAQKIRQLKRAEDKVWQAVFGQRVVKEGRKQLGKPYVWGEKTGRTGFDCSGFTAYVYNTLGVPLEPSASAQYRQGSPVPREGLQAGDLVFFLGKDSPMHVGIYEGEGRFLHAPGTGKLIQSGHVEGRYFGPRWVGARRLAPPLEQVRDERGLHRTAPKILKAVKPPQEKRP
jgi:hypothetical protein